MSNNTRLKNSIEIERDPKTKAADLSLAGWVRRQWWQGKAVSQADIEKKFEAAQGYLSVMRAQLTKFGFEFAVTPETATLAAPERKWACTNPTHNIGDETVIMDRNVETNGAVETKTRKKKGPQIPAPHVQDTAMITMVALPNEGMLRVGIRTDAGDYLCDVVGFTPAE